MSFEVEIDRLATELFGTDKAEQVVNDELGRAAAADQWDEVIKWNRVRWRLRMMARAANASPRRQTS